MKAAAAVSTRSANTVAALVSAIMEADARALAAEEKAAFEKYWQIRDKLAGYARTEPTKLADIADDITKSLNRQHRLAAKDPLLLENNHWTDFLNKIATGEEQEWRDYARRLTDDASAHWYEEPAQK